MAWHRKVGWFHRSKNHALVRSTGLALQHTSKAVHRLLAVGTGVLVLASCILAATAWRLAQAPIDLEPWSDRVRSALVDDPGRIHVSFDRVFLAWEGFHKGVDHPLDLRLTHISVTDRAGKLLVAAPAAHLTFSFAALLLGRIVPREIEVDHAQIAVTRETGGPIDLGWDVSSGNVPGAGSPDAGSGSSGSLDLSQFREQLSRPASSDHGRSRGLFDQIERAHFPNADITVRNQESGLIVRTSDVNLDIVRARTGHVRGEIQAPLRVGDQQANLTAEVDWAAGSETRVNLRMSALRLSDVGALPSDLAFLNGLDVPISLTATVRFDPRFTLARIQADLQLAKGQIRLGQGSIPVRSGDIAISGTSDAMTITKAHFLLANSQDGGSEIVEIAGRVTHEADRLSGAFKLALGKMDIADLPVIWPSGVGSGARSWVMEHVTGGTVTQGEAFFAIESDDRLRHVVLTQCTGELNGTNGRFTWIDNLPPVEQTDFRLKLVDPGTLDIHISSARQRLRNGGPDLLVADSAMRITGLLLKDQVAVIHTQVAGPIASALSLLKEPRLDLLSAHPISFKTGGGDVSAKLDFELPLQDALQVNDVQIHAEAHLTKLKLLDVVGGQGLDDGVFDLSIDKNGLSLKGHGSVATVPVTAEGSMDFLPGPPDQIIQRIAFTGQADSTKLDDVGVHVSDFVDGPIPLTAVLIERRNGNGLIAINSDLNRAALMVNPLSWHKSPGSPASISATMQLSHDRPTRIDNIALRGNTLVLTGSADFADGHFRILRLDNVQLGLTRCHGTIDLEVTGPIAIALQGEQIDLAPKFTENHAGGDRTDAQQAATPEWRLDAKFDRGILANGEHAENLLAKATGGGSLIRLVDMAGVLPAATGQPAAAFSVKILPIAGQRHLLVDTNDAGTFLRGIDAIRGMQSGHLFVDGTFTRSLGLYPLAGSAAIDGIVIKNSPFLGKLLQAITIYGLVDVLRESGMGFSRVVVPFRYDGANLDINEAHGSNASLGLTINGRIGLPSGQTNMTGTIVPAYFFNSMLGHLPLVGKLFSPEKGGGVFAARFGVDGPIDDPRISINPISALTPGFLRELFNVFDHSKPEMITAPNEAR